MHSKKKIIQDYWTKNVPGLDIAVKNYSPEQKEFYIEADNYRFKYEPYVIPLIESFAQKGRLILEIGCGLGSDSRYMAKKEVNITSLDLSRQNVFYTLKGMRLLNLNGKGVNADAENLPFKDNNFDAVYSFGVLHHTPDTKKVLAQIHRVLKPGGRAVIMLYHKGYAYYLLLLLHGWRSLLFSQTKEEMTSRYDHTPLSKMYSIKEAKEIFSRFRDIKFEVTTYGGIQQHFILKYIWLIFNKVHFLMRHFGSFLIIKCIK